MNDQRVSTEGLRVEGEPVAPGGQAASESQRQTPSYWRGTYRKPEEILDAQGSRAPHAQPAGGTVTDQARRAYAAEAMRQKDHVSAGLLAIFLGVFGVHKFYLGCNQAGFIMLAATIIGGILTFGLVAAMVEIIAVIEGVIYLTKSQTDFDRIYVLHERDWF